MTFNTERYIYRLDALDTITYVNNDYLSFARENQAPELDLTTTVGKSIWTSIAGDEVQALYRMLFHRLRSCRSEVIIPFRCDSPTVIRHMQLTMRSLSHGGVECEGRILHQENRTPVPLFSREADRSEESIQVCSLCRRLLIENHWTDVSSAIIQNRLFSIEPVPQLEETVCIACEETMQAKWELIEKVGQGEK